MIDRTALLSDVRRVLRELETDLRSRCDELPEVTAALRKEFEEAKEAQRTADNFEEWRSRYITQVAAAWVLSCIFVRFLEDNRLVEPPRISGPDERLRRARDEYDLYVHEHPTHTYRDYLLSVFDGIAELPGGKEVFGKHNPIHIQRGWLSGDAAGALLTFFQKIEPTTGDLVHNFADDNWDTRFLGDLYQDLSEEARSRYALLQTPEFIEEFILDRTLDPALAEFGIDSFRMIDPACGSGHFLLGSFARLFRRWSEQEPGTNPRVLVQRTLDSVHGVDVNPYAAAIARFRLLLAALRCCGVKQLADAPAFHINVVCGDSLLHGALGGDQLVLVFDPLAHAYQSEDLAELRRILRTGHYHVVVANPPYIVPKDKAADREYRRRYSACHWQYSLAVPFMQRIFSLALDSGFTGQITANSFMKREFGKKLIEEFFPSIDLNTVIDTSGAYIPGHGTPTVIILGRKRRPVETTVRAVMGITGEPTSPDNPATGLVWSAILRQIDHSGSESEYVSVVDSPRGQFHKHPWSLGGGGAADVVTVLEKCCRQKLGQITAAIGRGAHTGADDAYVADGAALRRCRISRNNMVAFVTGNAVRNWIIGETEQVLFPYDVSLTPMEEASLGPLANRLWLFRNQLWNRVEGGGTHRSIGMTWYEFSRFHPERFTGVGICYGEITTHNHFVLARGGKIFNRTAPVVKLPVGASEEDYLGLLGLLNSSTVCFWMKQVCHNKGSTVDQNNARQRTAAFEDFYALNSTAISKLPVLEERPTQLARRLDDEARTFKELAPGTPATSERLASSGSSLAERELEWQHTLSKLISLQEELDWDVYRRYGLLDHELTYRGTPPEVRLGQRAFEIALARKMAAGEVETTWFERHDSKPITEIPSDWPEDYRNIVQRRINIINSDRNIALIEQPEYKRRWNTEPWAEQLERALENWLLGRLEGYFDFDGRMNDETEPTARLDVALVSLARLSDLASRDPDFMRVAELYRGRGDFDVARLVTELVEDESVPLLPVLRYKPAAMDKRQAWERTWDLQRREDELARQRAEAIERIKQERERVSGKLPREKEELSALGASLRKQCLEVRDLFAREAKLPDDGEPEVLCWLLGQQGVSLSGGEALKALDQQRQKYVEKKTQFDAAVSKLCEKDGGYQAAVRAYETIPKNPEVPVPPEYKSSDFQKPSYWRLRGKLDVPKERWVSFPHCESEDGSPVVAWAGYDHLQLAQAVGTYYAEVKDKGGTQDPRLVPLLACLLELVPWLKQWHNEMDQTYQMRMGDYFLGYVEGEAKELGLTIQQIRDWTPPQQTTRRRRRQ